MARRVETDSPDASGFANTWRFSPANALSPSGASPRRPQAEKPMPGAGTDHTKEWTVIASPVIVLVEPQLGENIGTAARAMANFGLTRLRLVNPRQGWPNDKARMMATGATRI